MNPSPALPPQQYTPKKKTSGCLIALVIVAVLAIPALGISAVLAIYGVRKYIANAKTAEARNSLAFIARQASDHFASAGKLCPSASHPVPLEALHAVKYQSAPGDWSVDEPRKAGFACLHFALATPQYYSYNYTAHGTKNAGDGFSATAVGDLDGDGQLSTFEITGIVTPSGTLEVIPALIETNPTE